MVVMSVAMPVSAAVAPTGRASTAAAGPQASKPDKPKPTKPPKSPKPPKPPNPKPPKGAAPAPVDISSTMPKTMRDDLTGDFLGRGYDQRMRAENTSLNIYDSASLGAKLLHSTPMDLELSGGAASGGVDYPCNDLFGCKAGMWAAYSHESDQSCSGCFDFLSAAYELNTIYLARAGNFLFMTGSQGNGFDEEGLDSGFTAYRNWLYVLPADGSCASMSCAYSHTRLPDAFNLCANCAGVPRAIGVTSLAAGYSGGNLYVAVGLSDGGVQIYNVNNPNSPQLTDTFGGMATPDGSQTPPTALAWDPSGSGLLAIGVISWADEGFFVNINSNGKVQGSWLAWNQHGGDALVPAPLSVAFGQGGVDGKVVAFGMREGDGSGTLRLVDPTVSGAETGQVAGTTAPGPNGAIIAVNPIPRFDGTGSGSDFAVSYQTGTNVGTGTGALLRWDGSSTGLTALPVIAGSPNTMTPDWDTFRKWYPGIKEGRFQVSNTSAEPITVGLKASPLAGEGCWYAPSWADASAFPAGGVTVAAGQTSAIYPMGAYTAGTKLTSGTDGGCAVDPTTDPTGTWRGYLTITPVNHPADARLVGVRLNRDLQMSVDVTDQAGGLAPGDPTLTQGTTTVSIAYTGNHLAAYGLWNITVDTPAAPTPAGSPTVTAARVTPADFTDGPAVYRFDVTGATYQLPTPYPNQLVVPPLQVQGLTNGTTWTTLGTLIPRTEPTISPGPPAQLTLGPATFWWENPAGQPAYQQIRVALGPNGTPARVTLSSLPAPSDPTNVSGPQIAAATPSNGNAAPVDSGVDQAPLSVQVLNTNSQPLPPTDPSYQRIYYRHSATNTLITNLLPTGADPNTFLGVSPYAGAYPNNGSVTSSGPATFDGFHYLYTTSTTSQSVTGYIAGATAPSQPIAVLAPQISVGVTQGSSAASGIALTCVAQSGAASPCPLYPISLTQPALYLDTRNGVQIGLLTAAVATTSVGSLPLQQTSGTPEHLLASAPLTVITTAATLSPDVDNPNLLSSDHVDTTLVTHGVITAPTTIINIPVGS
jgi:hypothetical protein